MKLHCFNILVLVLGMALLIAQEAGAIVPTTDELARKDSWVRDNLLSTNNLPFSFTYGGVASSNLLPGWTRTVETNSLSGAATNFVVSWTDGSSPVKVYCSIVNYYDCPAVEWTVGFTNSGAGDSMQIAAVNAADFVTNIAGAAVTLNRINGSSAGAGDFIPLATALNPGGSINSAPTGGRSSDGGSVGTTMPFFNLDCSGGGLLWALGWSGSWRQQVSRDSSGNVRISGGLNGFNSLLHPGEHARSPRMLFVFWQGTKSIRGNNLFRRTLANHILPRRNGEIVMMPTSRNTFWHMWNSSTETTETNAISEMAKLGVEAYWHDAGWMTNGGWQTGVGSWYPDPVRYPNGMRPIGNACHSNGLKFILWIEPERAKNNSYIAQNYPQYLLGTGTDRLFDLGNPAAFRYMTNHISNCISNWGIDIYRTDFNVDPLPYWQANDATNRQGITENLHIQGLYAMWDGLHAAFPGLEFDSCAAGGRRIDLELMGRAYNLTRSDSVGWIPAATPEWDQAQTAGLSLYDPLNATISGHAMPGASTQPINLYNLRSTLAAGWDFGQYPGITGYDTNLFKQMIAETKIIRPYYTGDYYPLTAIDVAGTHWMAWQFNRPETGDGIVQIFRRGQSALASTNLVLNDIDASKYYVVENLDGGVPARIHGSALAVTGFPVQLEAAQSAILRYSLATGCVVTAGASYPLSISALPCQVQFSASGISTSQSASSYYWDFGDGGSSTEQNPVHSYQALGSYTGAVTMTDGAGNTARDTVAVAIRADFAWSMRLTFPGYTRAETLVNFPVLIVLSNSIATGFDHSTFASTQGWDLVFTDDTGIRALNYEVERWNPGGASYLWVQVPALSNGTAIVAYWGNSSLTSAPPACATNGAAWASGFRGVWHMGAGAGTNLPDATANKHSGTLNNGPGWTAGAVGGGLSFDGTDDTVTLGAELWDLDSQGSVSAWVYPRAASGSLLAVTTQGNDNKLLRFCQAGFIQAYTGGTFNDAFQPAAALALNQWHYITWTSHGTAWTFYDNGEPRPLSLVAGANAGRWFNSVASSGTQTYQLGDLNATNPDKLNGSVDELRVESVCRSSNWIWACYQTMASNSSFSACGNANRITAAADADGDGLPDAWEIRNFGSTNSVNGAATNDWDHDGLSNLAEYLAGTSPTNSSDSLRIAAVAAGAVEQSGLVLQWSSVTGRSYMIRSSTNLLAGFDHVAVSNIPATPAVNTATVGVDQAGSGYFMISLE